MTFKTTLTAAATLALGFAWLPQQLPGPAMRDNEAPRMAQRFSTYLGGSDIEIAAAVALDADGFVYVTGLTLSDDFPVKKPIQGFQGGLGLGSDVFVAKYKPGGDSLVYATYLGGSGDDFATALVVDAAGRACVAGATSSFDFPTANPIHSYQGGSQLLTDAFVACLEADGSGVAFATYLGGTFDDGATALALGPGGALYVAGTSTSTDFPTTPGAYQPARAGTIEQQLLDAFVARLTPDGNDAFDLDYATYLGGTLQEIAGGLAVDTEGRAWIAGLTTSTDFPLQDPLQAAYAGPIRDMEGDTFVALLSKDGNALDFATYLGGRQNDQATGLALDAVGRLYLTGLTTSSDFPTTPGAYQRTRTGLQERYVARLAPDAIGWRLDYATRLGSPGGYGMGRTGLAVDKAGRVWVAGATTSDTFPTRDPEQPTFGGGDSDAFLARLDADGTRLGYATFTGGNAGDAAAALALGDNTVCVTGSTGSPDFPTLAAQQPAFDGPLTLGMEVTSVFVTCFGATNEASVLSRLAVSPDSVGLIGRETQPFRVSGFDQFDQPLSADVVWSATGGAIDAEGFFTAPDDAGVYTITATDPATGVTGTAVVNIYSGVDTEGATDVPKDFALYGNYPNPFNPTTTIRFDVKASAHVVLTIYDLLGRRQSVLLDRDYAPGRHEVRFNARAFPSGTYFYVIEMGDFRAARRMLLLR